MNTPIYICSACGSVMSHFEQTCIRTITLVTCENPECDVHGFTYTEKSHVDYVQSLKVKLVAPQMGSADEHCATCNCELGQGNCYDCGMFHAEYIAEVGGSDE